MYDEQGKKTWEARWGIYGKKTNFKGSYLTACPFRYQGQYEDAEIGLYYNRFRYYSPDEGMYLSQDPIGLAGGNPTIYGYVKNVNSWVDVFGLDTISDSDFGIQVIPNSRPTKHNYQGTKIYEVTKNIDVGTFDSDGKINVDSKGQIIKEGTLKKGDYFYLDNLHKDHVEVFSKNHESKGVFNLDGTFNDDKAEKRKGPLCKK